MGWIKAQWKRFKWVLLALLGVAAGVLMLFLKGATVGPTGSKKRVQLPEINPALKAKVEAAKEEALVARIEARTVAKVEVEKLEEVAKIDDGAERRKRLAAMLEEM